MPDPNKTHIVVAAFATSTRRFAPGTDKEPVEISAADLDGPLGVDDLVRLGKLKARPSAEKKAKQAG